MRRLVRGLDEMALESAFIGVSALVFIVLLAYAVNSSAADRLEGVPLVGQLVGGVRALVGVVAH